MDFSSPPQPCKPQSIDQVWVDVAQDAQESLAGIDPQSGIVIGAYGAIMS
jgi:hypothetical protein